MKMNVKKATMFFSNSMIEQQILIVNEKHERTEKCASQIKHRVQKQNNQEKHEQNHNWRKRFW